MFKDIIGQPIEVGSFIFFGTTSRYAEFSIIEIKKLTPKTAVGRIIKCSRNDSLNKEVRICEFNHCVVVRKEYIEHLLVVNQ
jgi:hypothetical protein